MYDLHIDAYSPKEMARRVETIGVTKAKLGYEQLMALSILAGAFIGFGAEFFIVVTHDSPLGLGLTRLIGGLAFCLGLILVVVGGAELFTGNNLIVMAYVQKKITLYDMSRNWLLVFIGNFLGALALVLIVYFSRQYLVNHELVGIHALLIAETKVNYSWTTAFLRGILCNVLVSLAVWLSIGGRSVADKVLGIIFPITAFVASGFEHCVANMYFIPMGLLLKANPALLELAAQERALNLERLTWEGFIYHNLVPVTLGNMVGGVVLVGLAYWFIYLREGKKPNVPSPGE